MRRSRSDAENSTPAPTVRMPKVSSFGCVQARPPRAPDSLVASHLGPTRAGASKPAGEPGLEPPNPRQRVWRLQPCLGLAQQGLRTDLTVGRAVRRPPRQQGAILQCRHCQPLGVHCHRPSSGHVSTSLGRLPSPVSSASSRSPAIVGIARELADGAKTKLEIFDQG